MKANKIDKGRPSGLALIVILAAIAAVAVGAKLGFDQVARVYDEQCVIRDMSEQVEISSGKMVHPSTIAEELGLKVGANLATIDFARRSEELLAKVPNLRAIRITRKLPDKVVVVAEERMPIARMGLIGNKSVTGRVVDADGVVFVCQRGTQMLPTIREPQASGTKKGEKVRGRVLAALRLVEACREPAFLELGVLEVDTARRDFLVVTLGNYSKAKICWDEMDEPSARTKPDLDALLTRLRDAIRSQVTPTAVTWNVTMPGEVFADTQGKL